MPGTWFCRQQKEHDIIPWLFQENGKEIEVWIAPIRDELFTMGSSVITVLRYDQGIKKYKYDWRKEEMKEETMNMICEEVKEILGIGYTVTHQRVEKNNGLVLHGVTIKESGVMVYPSIYVDDLADRYEAGEISLQDLARHVACVYESNHDEKQFSEIVGSLSKEYIFERVVYQLVNKEKNAGRLADMPYKEILDLAAVYRIIVNEGEDDMASIAVSCSLCDKFEISTEELDAAAQRNTEARGFTVRDIASVLEDIIGLPTEFSEDGNQLPMFVLTNPTMVNGAAVMLYWKCFDDLAHKLGSDLYVLPSSIHEVIAVPVCFEEPKVIKDMVMAVNATEVPAEEVLSENVYRYSMEKRVLEIV